MTTLTEKSSALIEKLRQWTGIAHLIYLGLLPALATYAVLARYGYPSLFLIFIGGVTAVSVYLAATISYTRIPGRLALAFIMLVDGPLAVWVAQGTAAAPLDFAIEGYLVDGTAVWLGILLLALRSPRPTSGQRVASVGFMLLAIGTTTSLFWTHIQAEILGNWETAGPLLFGLFEATWLQFRLLRQDDVIRNSDATTLYIVANLMIWIGLMSAGSIVGAGG